MLILGCGDGDNTNTIDPEPVPSVTGQAILGPLAGATVNVYAYNNLATPIHSTTTTDSTLLSEAGRFSVPESLLDDNQLYVVKITGGEDIDADDDGVIDVLPTTNQGSLHLTAMGSQLKA
jgi:hypothetical protein